ncbi:MAG TPA: hypothetical protein VJT72_12400 [Pseudonocardiaceae bacterium]|nr:hypothetical protein [Pseudonocardiaceae bacterium]
MELESFLACARGLLTIPSTADRPEDLYRALEFVLDVVGPGFTVERFESRGKSSALMYLGPSRPRFRVVFNAHVDVVPAPPEQFQPRLQVFAFTVAGTGVSSNHSSSASVTIASASACVSPKLETSTSRH